MQTNSTSGKRGFTSMCLALAITAGGLAALPMAGCAWLQGDEEAQLLAMLEPGIRKAAESYIAELSTVASLAMQVDSIPKAIDVASKARPAVDRAVTAGATLNNASPETKDLVRRAFASKLKASNEEFGAALTKVSGSTTIAPFIKPVLERIPLFK